MIQLNDHVTDKVTGFTGIATAKSEHINGCVQFCIEPKMKDDGRFPESRYVDAQRLVVDEKGEYEEETGDPELVLGATLENIVNGFRGVTDERVTFHTGCVRYHLMPKTLKDGGVIKGEWMAAELIKICFDEGIVTVEPKPTGGAENPPSSNSR